MNNSYKLLATAISPNVNLFGLLISHVPLFQLNMRTGLVCPPDDLNSLLLSMRQLLLCCFLVQMSHF